MLNEIYGEKPILDERGVWEIPTHTKQLIAEKPTDYMSLELKMLQKLRTFWLSEKDINERGEFNVPADILWADTVPIKDMVIEPRDVDPEHRPLTKDEIAVNSVSIRIIQVQRPNIDDIWSYICLLGIVEFEDGAQFVVPFGITNDGGVNHANDICTTETVGILKYGKNITKTVLKEDHVWYWCRQNVLELVNDYIPVWYGIQIGLLNPAIKTVFEKHTNPKYVIAETKKDRKGKTKTKIRYVKRLVITDDVFDECVDRSYIRTKLCWYVTGHWRNQATKNGHKRIFIQGYWKGVAREMKRSDIREREMVLKEE